MVARVSRGGGYALNDFQGARGGGRTLRKGVFLPSKRLLSAFYNPPPLRTLLRTLSLLKPLQGAF